MIALPGAGCLVLRPSNASAAALTGIPGIFGNSRQVRELGEAYRHVHPGEDDIVTLERLITSSDVFPDLDDQVRRDFERGRTIQLQGWILSRTEGRQCALFSLLNA